MSTRPVVTPRALHDPDRPKEDRIADLTDYQFFVEQPGEQIVGDIIEQFVNEGVFTAFIPWIRETRKVHDVRIFPRIPDEMEAHAYFTEILNSEFPESSFIEVDQEGWDWEVTEKRADAQIPRLLKVQFYTRPYDSKVEMIVDADVETFNGPRCIVYPYDRVMHPARCENLQPPSPSNPEGARWVILVDHPTIDEIAKLQDSGFYDLLTKKELNEIRNLSMDESNDDVEQQKDKFQGVEDNVDTKDKSHGRLTLLRCFDLYDIDKDGFNEDMVWWVLVEPKLLVRARRLTEQYPSTRPERPFAEAQFFPVKGRRSGVGLPELMEGMHDFSKSVIDQAVDNGTLINMPFGFYRAASNMKPEVLRPWPGDMYPLSDPKNDVFFPQLNSGDRAFWFNMLSVAGELQDKQTMKGDLQLGRIPVGRSSALRTSENFDRALQQGEARPERILRRLFIGLTEIFRRFHVLNTFNLPDRKRYLIAGIPEQGQDPYQQIGSVTKELSGDFVFDFHANIRNASKQARQQGLQFLMQILVNPLSLQFGTLDADGFYKLQRDAGMSVGLDVDQYIKKPSPQASQYKIGADDALLKILREEMPVGFPMEGAQAHWDAIRQFLEKNEDVRQQLTPNAKLILQAYFQQLNFMAQQEQQQQALLMAAQQSKQGLPAQAGGNGAGQPSVGTQMPQVEANELVDETLPGNGRF